MMLMHTEKCLQPEWSCMEANLETIIFDPSSSKPELYGFKITIEIFIRYFAKIKY